MSLNCGILGMPNVGKTMLFNALTSTPAETASHPFSTIQPNYGSVYVPDKRLMKISEMIYAKKIVPTTVEFVDIAGLVKNSSKGEGLGNQFLGTIRQVGAIIHVVRCFDDDNVFHVEGNIDPLRDIEITQMELAFSDLDIVSKKLSNIGKLLRSNDKKVVEQAKIAEVTLKKVHDVLAEGLSPLTLDLSEDELNSIKELSLITLKKQIYCCNVDESGIEGNDYTKSVLDYCQKDGSDVIVVCSKLEADISQLETEEERAEFMEASGLKESSLDKLISAAYHSLNLQTFFTVGDKENRAWTFKKGSTAPQAAGVIHSDFERGFIRAEVYTCNDLFEYKNEHKIKEVGKFRVEGKEYIVKDGDILNFRFNV
jgi:hypothetical protein